jgi:PPOX class probable F420-dependent enzyme
MAQNSRCHSLSGPVVTPVWFARVGQALYIITDDDTCKVKRIRHHPGIEMAPSTARGKPTGPAVHAFAHVLPVGEAGDALRALSEKYGWLFAAFELLHRQHSYPTGIFVAAGLVSTGLGIWTSSTPSVSVAVTCSGVTSNGSGKLR